MIKLMIPWLLFPYLIDWFDGNFCEGRLVGSLFDVRLVFRHASKGLRH